MHYDTLIVGSGAAGSILAARLSEDPSRSVCIVEAGPSFGSVEALPDRVKTLSMQPGEAGVPRPVDWGLTARSNRLQPEIAIPRGKVIGGSSSINGMVCYRGLREDLDGWAVAGNPTWTYDNCLAYFARLEHDYDFSDSYHGTTGPIPISRTPRDEWTPLTNAFYSACLDLGYPDCPDLNRPDSFGVGPIPTNFRDGLRWGTAVGYLIPASTRPNLTIMGSTPARRVVFDGGRARAVEVVMGGRLERIEADEIILSAGALSSPHLLLLSGIGPAQQLTSLGIAPIVDLPGVGQNLRDHPAMYTVWGASEVLFAETDKRLPWQIGLRGTAPDSSDTNDMQVHLIFGRGPAQARFTVAFSLMHAESVGELHLTSADPTAPVAIDFRHFDDPSDMPRMRGIVRTVLQIGSHAALDGIRTERAVPSEGEIDSDPLIEEWILRNLVTGHHASCTCQMGPASNPAAVVDETGRVHGVDGLRVIDASIMPDCPRANTNVTTMMLAEKLADVLRA
jgi:choline dehydrogenase